MGWPRRAVRWLGGGVGIGLAAVGAVDWIVSNASENLDGISWAPASPAESLLALVIMTGLFVAVSAAVGALGLRRAGPPRDARQHWSVGLAVAGASMLVLGALGGLADAWSPYRLSDPWWLLNAGAISGALAGFFGPFLASALGREDARTAT